MDANKKVGPEKRIKSKSISSIQELPTDWKLLSGTTDEKKDYFIRDELKKYISIIEATYKEQNQDVKYIQFIGTKDTLSAKMEFIKSLVKNGQNVYVSVVSNEETKIIDEIYKTSKEEVKSEDKDYSLDDGVSKEVNDLFIKAINQSVSDIHLEVRKGFTRIRARTNGRITNFYQTSFAESTGYEWGRVIYQVMSAVSK